MRKKQSDEGRNQKLYNKFLINFVCLVWTRKYLPEVFFAQNQLRRGSVCTDQYFPVQTI